MLYTEEIGILAMCMTGIFMSSTCDASVDSHDLTPDTVELENLEGEELGKLLSNM